MIDICLLGATGSIGQSTLEVVRLHPDKFRLRALTANTDIEGLVTQISEFKPSFAVIADASLEQELRSRVETELPGLEIQILSGAQALQAVAEDNETHTVVAAIVGAAGLLPTLAAVKAGKRVLLANKEALVCAGRLFMSEVERSGAELLPLDSEHNAIFQCLPQDQGYQPKVRRILLTASGGPFRGYTKDELAKVTPEQAFLHPNWEMGQKISVDSATLMNKGLELIEACWLFGVSPETIEILVHPQSIVHSLVEYDDGSQLAQMGTPNMCTPIAHGLGFPDRISSGSSYLDLCSVPNLSFEKPDIETFDCLRLAIEAAKMGGSYPLFLNAANEVAVQAFIEGQINITEIALLVEKTLKFATDREPVSIDEVIELDGIARQHCFDCLKEIS